MPPKKNKRASSSGDRRQTRSVTTKATSTAPTGTPPSKKRKVQDPLTKDDIPSIVKAVLEALPGSFSQRADTTEAPDPSLQGQSSGEARSTSPPSSELATSQRAPSVALTAHSSTRQRETGNEAPLHIDTGE